MTAQFQDRVRYGGIEYDLAGISAGELFRPQDCGLRVEPSSTACWRGFACTYAVPDGRLVLDELLARIPGKAPSLNGVPPNGPERERLGFNVEYRGIALPIRFTGGLLIADEFIQELYVHMGFHPAWKYQSVRELIFEEGRLVEERDQSDRAREIREAASAQDLRPSVASSHDEIRGWIERCFSRRYSI